MNTCFETRSKIYHMFKSNVQKYYLTMSSCKFKLKEVKKGVPNNLLISYCSNPNKGCVVVKSISDPIDLEKFPKWGIDGRTKKVL